MIFLADSKSTARGLSLLLGAFVIVTLFPVFALAGGTEYTGQFEPVLAANVEDFERIVLTGSAAPDWSSVGTFENAHFASAKLIDPQTGERSILVLLVEPEDQDPVVFADVNRDNSLSPTEKFPLTKTKADNPYLWQTTLAVDVKGGFFTSASIFVRYFKSIQTDKMTREDRLLTQSTEVFARGSVEVNSKKVLVQYALVGNKKVNPAEGWSGIDANGDGNIDMDNLSPEAAKADNETVIFRVGDKYLSTKKADVSKNQIVLREHEAKEYKRVELYTGGDFPEFGFTDFDGKKRKLSEFRGKYLLLDIWGFWCPPCRKELPYIREVFRRFASRNLVVVGLNTDPDFTVDSMKKALKDNGMAWTHAQFVSVADFLRDGLRINSFPTTFLLSPEGKIISMSRHERDEPDLRGEDLLESLDEVLPK